MEENTLKISKEALAELLRCRQKLLLLTYAGVVNEGGYDNALHVPVNSISFKEIQDMSDDDLIEKYLY